MKFRSYIIFASLLLCSCNFNKEVDKQDILDEEDYLEIVRHPISLEENVDTSKWSKISFSNTEYRFDTVQAGAVIKKTFEFTNSGDKPLYILDTRVSCGCTVAEYEKDAIQPGEKSELKIEFNTSGKKGEQNKSIIVLSNSHPNEDRLLLRGFVK